MNSRDGLRGALGAALAMCFVGTLAAVSATLGDYPIFGGQAVRYAVAAVILFAADRVVGNRSGTWRHPRGQREWALLAGLAATGLAAFNVFVVSATHYAGPATVGTVIATVPIALALVGPALDGRRPHPRVVVAAMVVTAGAALANGLGSGSVPGLLLALGALGGEVCFSLLAVPLLPALGPVRVSAYSAALAAPMLFAAGLAVDGAGVVRVPTAGEAAGLAYLAAIVTTIAFFLWYDALGRLGADRAGLFAGLIPVSAVGTTVVLGLGRPGPPDLAGAALVAVGVVAGLSTPKARRTARYAAATTRG
jgi:drug/metabolite transporter (DMT)-like permease